MASGDDTVWDYGLTDAYYVYDGPIPLEVPHTPTLPDPRIKTIVTLDGANQRLPFVRVAAHVGESPRRSPVSVKLLLSLRQSRRSLCKLTVKSPVGIRKAENRHAWLVHSGFNMADHPRIP